jgi:hypothetical protein
MQRMPDSVSITVSEHRSTLSATDDFPNRNPIDPANTVSNFTTIARTNRNAYAAAHISTNTPPDIFAVESTIRWSQRESDCSSKCISNSITINSGPHSVADGIAIDASDRGTHSAADRSANRGTFGSTVHGTLTETINAPNNGANAVAIEWTIDEPNDYPDDSAN